jgi:hypothetical protein
MNLTDLINRGFRSFHSFIFCLFVMVLLFTSCVPKPQPYAILEFTGNEIILNYSKSLFVYSQKSDSVNPAALLAGEGDLIYYGDELFIYRKSAGTKFQFNISKDGGYINGKITTLNLLKRNDATSWFKMMKTTDLSGLDFIKIDSLIPEIYYPYLATLAEMKPGIGIYYDGDISDISRLIKLFNPQYLVGETFNAHDSSLFSGLTNLELLVAGSGDSVITGPLPAMPRLKRLFLTHVNDKVVLDDRFLSENKSLESVTLMESKKIDMSVLNPLNNLKELVISNFDTILNFHLLKNQKNLEVLSILSEKPKFIPSIEGLPRIRWMTFAPATSQAAFNSFLAAHPNLEVAEILDNSSISSLSAFLKMRNHYGLIIADTLTDLSSVKSMKNLKYLSLPEYVLQDKPVKEDLQKLLPGARIVANEGLCLGSGWLLLIVPLVLLLRMVSWKKS